MVFFQQNKLFEDNIWKTATVVLGWMACTMVVHCSLRGFECTKKLKIWSSESFLKEYRQHRHAGNLAFGKSRGQGKSIWSEVSEMIIGPPDYMGSSIWGPRMWLYSGPWVWNAFGTIKLFFQKCRHYLDSGWPPFLNTRTAEIN